LKKNKCKCWYGIKTGKDKFFIFDLNGVKKLDIEEEVVLPLLTAKDCDRYSYPNFSKYVIYPYKLVDNKTVLLSEDEIENKYPKLNKYLWDNKEEISLRKDSRKNFSEKSNWYSLIRFGKINIFNREKIVFPGISKGNKFGLDKEGYVFSGASVYAITSENPDISLEYLLAILNSSLIENYLHSITPLKKGGFYSYLSSHMDNLSIPIIDSTQQEPFIIKINEILLLNEKLNDETNGFKDWLHRPPYHLGKLPKKLDKYYKLSFGEFLSELNKKKVDTKQRKTQELLKKEFEESISKINPLLQKIEKTDKEIDQMVYELYGLNNEEIKIIENSK